MIQIAPQLRPPLATLLLAAALLIAVAVIVSPRGERREVFRITSIANALGVAVVLTLVSALLWSERGAGTGIEMARGWPRIVYSRWTSSETREQTAGIRWRGIAESVPLYGAAALFVAANGRRRRPDRVS